MPIISFQIVITDIIINISLYTDVTEEFFAPI